MAKQYVIDQNWSVVLVEGPEARDFLHRITSANFRGLAEGEFLEGTMLQANGKITLYFKAYALGPQSFVLLIPAGFADSVKTVEILERLHFAENLKILALTRPENRLEYARVVCNSAAEIPDLTGTGAHIIAEPVATGILFPATARQTIEERLQHGGFKPDLDFERLRILAGSPSAPQEINTGVMPLEIKLDHAVHENKGCYPGQEVIERIRSMGQAPRGLVRVRGKGQAPTTPVPLFAKTETGESVEAGTVTSSTSLDSPDTWAGLAIVKKTYLKTPSQSFELAGHSVTLETD